LLLVDTLRGQWNFTGHVVSDCWALRDIHAHHKYTADAVETAALALKCGCDLSCGCTYDLLGEAVERGLITEADIDTALTRTLTTRFKLGMFDPPDQVPLTQISTSVINSPEHRQLAYEAALESIVLLKNEDHFLPLRDNEIRRIFVTGPNAASIDALLGNYSGFGDSLTTLLEGIVGHAPEGLRVTYRPGCQLDRPNMNPIDWATPEASLADVVIACMGFSPLLEGEEGDSILSSSKGDRLDIGLPAAQVEYLTKLSANGGKIVLVLWGGGPIALGEVEELAQAIVFVWYPGQEGGKALAEMLFGDASPSGKLPITFPHSLMQLPPFDDYTMTGRTYRYMTAEPLYPFGFGLSYTQFAYRDLKLAQDTLSPGEPLPIEFTLTNVGAMDADEVAQIYLADLDASTTVPLNKLIGFRRVHLAAGESKTIAYTITPETMQFVDENGEQKLEPGLFRVTAGGCSPGSRGIALGAPEPATALFTVR
jgi:beta-glucosidase